MSYDLARLPIHTLFAPVAAATAALTRLDERVAKSPVGEGWIARSHFADAAASLWIDGELVHLEDLVLHDAGMGIRAPTHELTIAHDVLRTRRRVMTQARDWALSVDGLKSLRGEEGEAGKEVNAFARSKRQPSEIAESDAIEPNGDEDDPHPLAKELAAMDAVLARSEAVLSGAFQTMPTRATPLKRNPLLYEPDWDEDELLDEWCTVLSETEGLPPVLRAVLLLDAWNSLAVLQHAPWLGRLLAASLLRESGTTGAHLLAFNFGLKKIPRERRASRDRDTRLFALLEAIAAAAEAGMKEHDRLLLGKQQMQHRLAGKRQSSKLPQLIDLVLSKPMVSANMIAKELGVTQQGALKIAGELNLRELTGRGRFRAWGML